MKQVKSFLKIFSLGLLLVGGAACTGNFDEINRKEYEVTKDEQGRENYNIGSTLRGLQGLVVPTKEHLYQFIEALAAGPFAGYYGTTLVRTDKFETYNPSVDWQDKTYGDIFTESYPLYRDLQDQSDDPVALALAKLLRVAIMHRMTDMYGPIPYSKVIDEHAVQTSAHFGKNGKVNAGNLVLAVIIELSPLQAAFFTHKVFTFMFFF